MESIRFWNRYTRGYETENVYGDRFVRWLYCHPLGQQLTDRILSKRALSKWVGRYQDSAISRREIGPFIKKFSIKMEEYEPGPFKTFNEFFIRRFQPAARSFNTDPSILSAPAEGRYLGYESIHPDIRLPIKGKDLLPTEILATQRDAEPFVGGPALIIRLCPVDYHRFHFPDDGLVLKHWKIPGALHSVNPLALRYRSEIFKTNERQVTLLQTKHFGKIAYVEVGALCVGKIVQTQGMHEFRRGQEKGYFLFGASTIVLFGEKDRWKPSPDILENTGNNTEVFVRLGDVIGQD